MAEGGLTEEVDAVVFFFLEVRMGWRWKVFLGGGEDLPAWEAQWADS